MRFKRLQWRMMFWMGLCLTITVIITMSYSAFVMWQQSEAVRILFSEEKMTEAAEMHVIQSRSELRAMIVISLACLLAALVVLGGIARTISRPAQQTTDFARSLAAGDFHATLLIDRDDELGALAASLGIMRQNIREVLRETERLTQAVQAGQLEVRGNTEAVSGGWRDLILGVNGVIDAFVTPFDTLVEYLNRLAKGDIPPALNAAYQGDFNIARQNVNQCLETITELVAETFRLAESTVQGRFDIRGNPENFEGDYAAIVEGMNSVIATLVSHIDRIPVPVMLVDSEFTIRYINQAGAAMVDTDRTQLIGKQCYDYFKTDVCQTSQCTCARAMQRGKIESGETTARLAKGERLLVQQSIPVRDQAGTIIGGLETVLDQTEIKQAMNAVQNQNWMRTGQTELNDVMRGEQDLASLTKGIITYLTQYLQADIGTLYLADEESGQARLRIVGSYGHRRRQGVENTIPLGENLAGQAALERESIVYTDVPENYLPIRTEFEFVPPRAILAVPFLFGDTLKGVIEIGTLGAFSDVQVEFVNQVAENIAMTVHSSQARLGVSHDSNATHARMKIRSAK